MKTEYLIEWLDFGINSDTLINTKGGRATLQAIRAKLLAAEKMREALESVLDSGENECLIDFAYAIARKALAAYEGTEK